ncbi:hypothetical protein FUA26_14825 [Seonamhaeicola algicola]|uniref:Uncharacterized protein n=1 Tax=Seonamhaeicola algicola TaxID=1719036 RepID=A0A5C7AE91_9FLAO|nr:hypothetical protein [Seonamhaeicola algicola]TXE06244.1 hypothetical protein FUA26_14825 [Seonamhaeicola algicola]
MKYKFHFHVVFLFFVNICISQNTNQNSKFYALFDAYVQTENLEVYNGKEFLDEHPELIRTSKTNNKFFGVYDFLKGTVTYNHQPYFDIELKYNLVDDLVLVKYINEKVNLLSLNSSLLSNFSVLGKTFVKLPKSNAIASSVYANGFFEEQYKGTHFSFYVKHQKEVIEEHLDGRIVYSFRRYENYIVGNNSNYYHIATKKQALKSFPAKEKEIKQFFKKNKILRKADKQKFYHNLFRHLDTLND